MSKPAEKTDSLNEVLAFAEEKLSEGDYMIVAKALKQAHEVKNPDILSEKTDSINLCVVANGMEFEIKNKILVCFTNDTRKFLYTYSIHRNGFDPQWQTLQSDLPLGQLWLCHPLMEKLQRWLTICNDHEIGLLMDNESELDYQFDYKKTLEQAKQERELRSELNDEDDMDEPTIYDFDEYVRTVCMRIVKFIIDC